MELTHVILKVKESRKTGKEQGIAFLVDSGAVYSLVPADMLHSLGCEPYKENFFSLANGTTIRRKVGMRFLNLRDRRNRHRYFSGSKAMKRY